VDDFLDQVEATGQAGLYYVALLGALAIPDICGAMEAADGTASRARYIAWFDTHVAPRYTIGSQGTLSGEDAWHFRCSMMHQGRTQHRGSTYSRIMFLEPGTGLVMHNNVMNDALNLDVSIFCTDMVVAARAWLAQARHTPAYRQNYPLFVQRYPTGLPPYIVGPAVIS
jgi:hypothetical protein